LVEGAGFAVVGAVVVVVGLADVVVVAGGSVLGVVVGIGAVGGLDQLVVQV
jgi:hypothetical protein